MNVADLLTEGYSRIRETVHGAVEGLGPDDLGARLDDGANSIAWLVWHLARVQDDHIADAAGTEQVWFTGDWVSRFRLPFAHDATGYGQSSHEVDALGSASEELLLGYYDAVHERTSEFLEELNGRELDRIVDESWTPAVTLGVRLVSVLSDDLQHAGQAAFVRGCLERRRSG
ncbi:mycothiol transferase [Streptomyces sp. NPDC001515]